MSNQIDKKVTLLTTWSNLLGARFDSDSILYLVLAKFEETPFDVIQKAVDASIEEDTRALPSKLIERVKSGEFGDVTNTESRVVVERGRRDVVADDMNARGVETWAEYRSSVTNTHGDLDEYKLVDPVTPSELFRVFDREKFIS